MDNQILQDVRVILNKIATLEQEFLKRPVLEMSALMPSIKRLLSELTKLDPNPPKNFSERTVTKIRK